MEGVMRKFLLSIILAAIAFPALAQSPRHAVGPLPGYACMSLRNSDRGLALNQLPKIYSAPSPSASQVAIATAIVIAKSPLHQENGFIEVMRLNGQPGWIGADAVMPFRSVSDPHARCVPVRMSDGSIGTSG
jgi:hypothetical protein